MRVLSRSKKAAAPGTPSRLLAAVGEQLARGSSADWAREEVALSELAAERPQPVRLLLCLDALRNHVHAERATHREDRGDDRLVLVRADDAVDERAVDLEGVDREAAHVGERRVARAEVVEREAHPGFLEAVERGQRGGGVLDERALRDLDAQQVGGETRALERLDDRLYRARMAELARREVHGHAQGLALSAALVPAHGLGARLLEHAMTERHDQAALLGDGDEVGRGDQAALGVLPANERLEADDLARARRDDRLVEV